MNLNIVTVIDLTGNGNRKKIKKWDKNLKNLRKF